MPSRLFEAGSLTSVARIQFLCLIHNQLTIETATFCSSLPFALRSAVATLVVVFSCLCIIVAVIVVALVLLRWWRCGGGVGGVLLILLLLLRRPVFVAL